MVLTAQATAINVKPYRSEMTLGWGITLTYICLMVLIPISAVFIRASHAPASELLDTLKSPIAQSALALSFGGAFVASVINGCMGLVIAWVLVRYEFPGKSILNAVIDIPFALPTAVAGITLSELFSPRGWMGSLGNSLENALHLHQGTLAFLNFTISYTQAGVFLAMIFISMPFVVRAVQPVLQEIEPEVEDAAESLGAGPWRVFIHIILPSIRPALLTGVALGFARAVGEYGSVVIISGNIPLKTLIAPVLIYEKVEEFDQTGAAVIASVMLLASFIILLFINILQYWRKKLAT